ncbi:unnamed protein product [Symbiodinium sp. CCMP2592]|nr:unnamed protein product [Symbiodinium sp. CCMP2592]
MSNAAGVPIEIDEDDDLENQSPTEIADEEEEEKDNDEQGVNNNLDPRDDPGQCEGEQMQVDPHLGALGEVRDEGVLLGGGKEKRKRGRCQVKKEQGHDDDEDEESPTKRASTDDVAPVSGRELRELLALHLQEMKGQIGGKLQEVQVEQQRQLQEIETLKKKATKNDKEIKENKGRTTANEKHLHDIKTKVELHDDRINEVTASLAKLQSDLNSRPQGATSNPAGSHQGPPLDPWANWRQNQANLQKKNGHLPRTQMGDFEENGQLSEEEKRTLIVGGWAQDTKKSVIEMESRELLARDELKDLVDAPVLTVFGPRRSVGNLKFDYRANESFQGLRERMWKTMKAIRELAIHFQSAKDVPGSKPAWASFVKTKEARRRTMLVRQVRRVCIQLAMDATSDQGGPSKPAAINAESYDTDWGNGTVWHESHKLASATHRQPTPNTAVILMPGGWVDLKAVMDVTGCSETEARRWNEDSDGIFYWLHHRHDKQYRGVAIGFAHDLLDCVIEKVACERGIWVLARIRGLGRVVFGSLHAHTGVTHAVYKEAVQDFFAKFKRKWRQWPVILGADVNEQPTWDPQDDGGVNVIDMSLNLQCFMHEASAIGLRANAPGEDQYVTPTHYPRDETRNGRQIDMILCKHVVMEKVMIYPELRHCVGTDHACLQALLPQRRAGRQPWGNDSRPRKLVAEVDPQEIIVDVEDVCRLAKQHTARSTNDKTVWKKIHKVTKKVQLHLEEKLVDKSVADWSEQLREQIQTVPLPAEFVPATREEICEEVNKMKRNVSVGPDGVSVDFLVHLLYQPSLGQQLTDLVNHIIRTNEQQEEWRASFLALLAKCTVPEEPRDLRPICMSSSFAKLVNRVIIGRLFPTLRRGSKISSCGRGRQSADLIGSLSRVRDIVREWDESILVTKLDIAGAFDKISRQKVVDLILQRTSGSQLGYEVRYLLGQLDVFELQGMVPGGDMISVKASSGIKQGAPESAELFGIIMGWLLEMAMGKSSWKAMGAPFADLDLELMYFQDDVFLLETSASRVARKIAMLRDELASAGLHLAMNKTKIIASPAYRGKMSVLIGDQSVEIHKDESVRALGVSFNFSAPVSQQAHELLGRARAAFAEHRELLTAPGSWEKKLNLVETLIMSTWRWCAGAVHWPKECLAQANTLQSHILRTAFGLRRKRDEDWVTFNSRTMRFIRQFLVQRQVPRWSSVILRLQHALHGHWARRVETIGPHGEVCPNITMRAIMWRDLRWWRGEQAKNTTGRKHPKQFYACNPERNIAESIGTTWANIALDRARWSATLSDFLNKQDVRWCRGRQLSIEQ